MNPSTPTALDRLIEDYIPAMRQDAQALVGAARAEHAKLREQLDDMNDMKQFYVAELDHKKDQLEELREENKKLREVVVTMRTALQAVADNGNLMPLKNSVLHKVEEALNQVKE